MDDRHKKGQMDYFKISDMSKAFLEWEGPFLERIGKELTVEDEAAVQVQLWQSRALLACAQQLSVLNVTLKKLAKADRHIGPDDMIYPTEPEGE